VGERKESKEDSCKGRESEGEVESVIMIIRLSSKVEGIHKSV